MDHYNALCRHLEVLVPEARNVQMTNLNPSSPELQAQINKFMTFCSTYPGVVMLNADIIWEFLYIVSGIIQRNDYKFKFQDQIQYNRQTNYQTQIYEEANEIPLDELPRRN